MTLNRFFLLLAFLALITGREARAAAQLGDTRAEVESRYDTAPVGDKAKGIAIYGWGLWKMEIHYKADAVLDLIYTKIDPLEDAEVRTILEQNGGFSHWKVTASAKDRAVSWTRSDGATAVLDPAKWKTLTLHGGKMPTATPIPALSAAQPATTVVPKIIATPLHAPATPVVPEKFVTPVPSPAAPDTSGSSTSKTSTLPPFHALIELKNLKYLVLVVGALVGLGMFLAQILAGPKKPKAEYPFAGNSDGTAPKNERYLVPVMETTNWQHFELLIAEVYRRKGYEVEISSGDGADGGIDLRLRKDGELVLAQCKRWLKGKVTVGAIREFYGVMTSENATRGIFLNTSEYSQDALSFAQGKNMELLDKEGVRELITSVTRPGENIYDFQRWLPEFLREAVITHPDCPFCKKPMVLRNSKNGRFWSCATYPQCQGKRDARLDLLKTAAA